MGKVLGWLFLISTVVVAYGSYWVVNFLVKSGEAWIDIVLTILAYAGVISFIVIMVIIIISLLVLSVIEFGLGEIDD